MTFWGGWKYSLIFLNNLSVDHKHDNDENYGESNENDDNHENLDCIIAADTGRPGNP